jgi:hypothetical protein
VAAGNNLIHTDDLRQERHQRRLAFQDELGFSTSTCASLLHNMTPDTMMFLTPETPELN